MKFALIVLLGLYVGLVCICISDVCTLFTSITTASAFMCHAEMCKNRSPATTACFIEKCTADIDNNKSGCRMQCTLLHGNPPSSSSSSLGIPSSTLGAPLSTLTSGDWEAGWNLIQIPEFPFSHLAVCPPR